MLKPVGSVSFGVMQRGIPLAATGHCQYILRESQDKEEALESFIGNRHGIAMGRPLFQA